MKYDFFTFGGGQFWEDVFFYQKWRIQRNYKNKGFRLLDPWDIRRFEGSFEDCRRAFVKFVSVYQLARQKGKMIIMLHGLAETKNIFKPLWRKALSEGFMAAAINYPSTQKHIESHVKQLCFLLDHLEDVQEVSFVTDGVGGIILQRLLESEGEWKKKLRIGRAVMVSPPNRGSLLLTKLSKYAIVRKLLGPISGELNPENMPKSYKLFPKIEIGVIATRNDKGAFYKFIPESLCKYFYSKRDSESNQVKETVVIGDNRLNHFKNPRIVNACINFLKNGKFGA